MKKKKPSVRKILSQIAVPDPFYTEYTLEYFVGRSVKISFDSSKGSSESMWVSVTAVKGGQLIGSLDNDPQVATHLKHGDAVTLSRSQIISVALDKHEWLQEVDIRRAKSDFFNNRNGVAHGSEFERLYELGLGPAQALATWRDFDLGHLFGNQ